MVGTHDLHSHAQFQSLEPCSHCWTLWSCHSKLWVFFFWFPFILLHYQIIYDLKLAFFLSWFFDWWFACLKTTTKNERSCNSDLAIAESDTSTWGKKAARKNQRERRQVNQRSIYILWSIYDPGRNMSIINNINLFIDKISFGSLCSTKLKLKHIHNTNSRLEWQKEKNSLVIISLNF